MPVNNIAANIIEDGVENRQILLPQLPKTTKNHDIVANNRIINTNLAIII